jgi:hypothetical protein
MLTFTLQDSLNPRTAQRHSETDLGSQCPKEEPDGRSRASAVPRVRRGIGFPNLSLKIPCLFRYLQPNKSQSNEDHIKSRCVIMKSRKGEILYFSLLAGNCR